MVRGFYQVLFFFVFCLIGHCFVCLTPNAAAGYRYTGRVLALKNGVAVVTGAAGGIGAALALVLAAKGCHLGLADLKAEPLGEVATRARSFGVTVS